MEISVQESALMREQEEAAFIAAIPYEELPLHINDWWLTDENEEMFLSRLKGAE